MNLVKYTLSEDFDGAPFLLVLEELSFFVSDELSFFVSDESTDLTIVLLWEVLSVVECSDNDGVDSEGSVVVGAGFVGSI